MSIALPGQVIGAASSHIPGAGTHTHDSNILASISGSAVTTPAAGRGGKPSISIARNVGVGSSEPLPAVNSTVLCRVLRVQQRQLTASILSTDASNEGTIISYSAITNDDIQSQAILRKEDVRAYEKDKIVMNEVYRVGDIIKATVISLGDERSYYISTAGNEYGVVVAKSEAGNAMVPVSWKEMKDVVTGKGEPRKVAKPS